MGPQCAPGACYGWPDCEVLGLVDSDPFILPLDLPLILHSILHSIAHMLTGIFSMATQRALLSTSQKALCRIPIACWSVPLA
jgi:hypothetical protein